MENAMLFPGDTIGIIGDSQNGIMLAQAAKKMGFKVAAYCTGQSVPTLSEADVKIVGRMNDKENYRILRKDAMSSHMNQKTLLQKRSSLSNASRKSRKDTKRLRLLRTDCLSEHFLSS